MPDVLALTSPPRRGPACRSRAAPRSAPVLGLLDEVHQQAGKPARLIQVREVARLGEDLQPAVRDGAMRLPAGLHGDQATAAAPHDRGRVSTMTGSLSVALIVWPPGSTTVRKVARKARRGPRAARRPESQQWRACSTRSAHTPSWRPAAPIAWRY